MSDDKREFKESPQGQGAAEIVRYYFSTTPYGAGTASGVVVTVRDYSQGWLDVTATVMPVNSLTVAADVVTLSPLKLLTANHRYYLQVVFVLNGNTFSVFCFIDAKD